MLSSGHASTLLYSLLHLTGVKSVDAEYERLGTPAVALDDLKQFRQLGSKCPGHPEYHWTSGVETTTGPLGQGIANSVGMAIAADWLARHFNRPGFACSTTTSTRLCGDGCMMEGVGSEAASLAGHLKLGNLCWIYDSNHITIEGNTALAFSEDVAARFLGYGWQVSGSATPMTASASRRDRRRTRTDDRPTLIIVESHIGYGAPHKQDTSPRTASRSARKRCGDQAQSTAGRRTRSSWCPMACASISPPGFGARGAKLRAEWLALFERYRAEYPELADACSSGCSAVNCPEGWDKDIPVFPADPKGIASRDSSAKVLNAIAPQLPWLFGGAADLAPSTKTRLTFEGAGDFEADQFGGRNFHFGIREHAMGSICNGMSLSKLRPFGSGFLIFSDYMKAPIRLAR